MKNAGVWIDHHKAVLVIVDPSGERTETFSSEFRDANSPGHVSSYTRNDFTAEDRLERKESSLLNRFYDRVIEAANGCGSVVVFGPGEAKLEFAKRFEQLHRHGIRIETEAADKMTENQVVAHVKQKFLAAAKQ